MSTPTSYSAKASDNKRRVVITGVGAVSPLGLTAQETWKNALEGRSGIGKISLFDPTDCSVQIAGEVKNFDVTRPLPGGPLNPFRGVTGASELTQAANGKDARKFGRFTHLALVAGIEAYTDSGLDQFRDKISAARMGTNIGVGMGGLPEIEEVHNDYLAKGYRRITPFFITQSIPNLAAGQLSILLNLQGPNLCNTTACTSSAHSLGESFRQIQRGEVDVMLAGGAEAVVCRMGIGGFAAMRALSTRNDTPETASRPFDQGRDGFVMGEGSAVVVLEEYEHAKKRGAKIYGEMLGYGLSADAFHMTTPAPEGAGGGRAMNLAITDAGINRDEVGYVNAHGTSTPAGDVEESRAIARNFPNGPKHLHVSSTKSMTGHLLGAAGAIEAMFCILAIKNSLIPPTINLESLDPGCAELKLDFTANRAVEKSVKYALSNSFGFGGTNASLLFGKL
ncbi:MAG: beta-ketoacyl-ACP synthase II [Methylotenera sp.]|nr:beta-ketoacyl-ACP synthase II [Oligoflexia bacterium]